MSRPNKSRWQVAVLTMPRRLELGLHHAEKTQTDLAHAFEQLGMSATVQMVNRWLRQGALPSGKYIMAMPHVFRAWGVDLSMHWLLTGDGPMLAAGPDRELEVFRQIRSLVDTSL